MLAWAYTACMALGFWLFALLAGVLVWRRFNIHDQAYDDARLRDVGIVAWLMLLALEPVLVCVWTANVTGQGPSATLTILPGVLSATHFGHAMAVRWLALLALGVAFLRYRGWHVRVWIAVCLIAFAWSHSIAGHAGETSDFGWPVWVDSMHFLATTVWAGFILAGARPPLANAHREYARTVQRLSTIAAVLLVLVAATGIANAGYVLHRPADLLASAYGHILDAKLAAVAVALVLAAVNRYLLLPRLALACSVPVHRGPVRDWMYARFLAGRRGVSADSAQDALRISLGLEAVTLFIALFLAALLHQSMPPMAGG